MAKISAWMLIKIATIGILVGLITLVHYQTAPEAGLRHVIFRELYFLPIILGSFWFGMRGGLATALIISILYGPLVLVGPDRLSAHDFGNIMEIALFNLIGGLLGWLQDRKTAQEERLREAENLAAMGKAAAMIAHDFKTPLVTIGGLANQLRRKITPATPEGEKLLIIHQQAARLEKLVLDILFFAKPMKLIREPGNLGNLLLRAKEAVSETARNNGIEIHLPAEASYTCHLDHEKMTQVFINLFTNAIEASPPGKNISVSLRRGAAGLRVDVSDCGPGIPDNLRASILEPFVSGKNKGTGLGLPICSKIIEAHAGKLAYGNNPDGGATFTVILPDVQ